MRHRFWIVPLFGLVGLARPVSAQTVPLGYAGSAAQVSGSSADYGVTVFSSATAPALLALTSGVTVSGIDMGTLSFSSVGRGPATFETIPFSFTRPLSLSVGTGPAVPATETISGTWAAATGGSAGQYLVTNFALGGTSAFYNLGAGTLQADFLPGTANYDGLNGAKTILITANFTFLAAPVPEASPLGLLGVGGAMLAGAILRGRRRG